MRHHLTIAVTIAASFFAMAAPSVATNCSSVASCLLGNNTGAGVGVEGVSQRNVGIYGVSTSDHGIDGRSRQSYGVVGYTYAVGGDSVSARAGVYGLDAGPAFSDNAGVLGSSTYGYGVRGEGAGGVIGRGESIGGGFETTESGSTTVIIENEGGGPVLTAFSGSMNVASIDGAGNEILAGTLTQNGTPLFQTKTNIEGLEVTSYGDRTASPMMEDVGSAQLRNGAAFVALDSTFASAIDTRHYMVFVTPHGDSNSLYTIVQPTGFVVRESKGGRSTLGFDFRIVAKPLDANLAHLPVIAPKRHVAIPALSRPAKASALK